MREGGLATQPLGVVAGGDQQLPGGVDPHPRQGDQGGGDRTDQRLELEVEPIEFGLEVLPAPSQGPQGGLVAAMVLVSGPGRMAAHACTRTLVLRPSSGARSSSGRCPAPVLLLGRRDPGLQGAAAATPRTRIIST